ncbi:hypothetical protein [Ectobacillus polymachus]|uniref:hypothetical protein n=1 Tax=Ectobacillus polymachus TaxID=1508806 RepID=UPI003A8C8104
MDCEIWQEWQRLWERMLALEKKLEDSIQVCEAWYVCKRIVYETQVIIPLLFLLEVIKRFMVDKRINI